MNFCNSNQRASPLRQSLFVIPTSNKTTRKFSIHLIFMYSCSARLISFEMNLKTTDFKTNPSGSTRIYEYTLPPPPPPPPINTLATALSRLDCFSMCACEEQYQTDDNNAEYKICELQIFRELARSWAYVNGSSSDIIVILLYCMVHPCFHPAISSLPGL